MDNKIAEGIFWVGTHFSEPAPGVSMNSFLIIDEKATLIDTGPPASARRLVSNIKKLIDPRKLDYVIITHSDVDHIGGLSAVLEDAPQATVLVSPYELRGFGLWGLQPAQVKTVEDGETVSLGRRRLRFVSAPFTCMPGTMMVFEESESILFSADLFAAMGPSQWRLFADTDQSEMLKGVQGIKLGNTRHIRTSLEQAKSLPVKIIASGHGPLINSHIPEYIDMLLKETERPPAQS